MDRQRILSLLDLLKSSSVAELAVREGEAYVRLQRATAATAAPEQAPPSTPGMAVVPGLTNSSKNVVVGARLVGFFHPGQGPDGPPLVQVGDQVKQGQVIGTIESLRQITAVTAPVAGTVVEVVAQEHQAVQFGDALIILRPTAEG